MAKGTEEEVISLDMTKAKRLESIPANTLCLVAISKWKPGKTANGRKIDTEFTVIEPAEYKNRKLPESTSLENEYTLGRFQGLLMAMGYDKEAVSSSSFKLPVEKDVLGTQLAIVTGIQAETEQYPERNTVKRYRPAESFSAEQS